MGGRPVKLETTVVIFRFRIEAESTHVEDVQEEIEEATQKFLSTFAKWYPKREWECTDEVLKPIARNGEALMYMRRVFRVMEVHDA